MAAAAAGPEAARLGHAVERFEESHVSTIHGFCADLLRERPVEARIDPSFAVLTEGQSDRLYDEAFADWIQRELDRPCEGVRRSLRRESKKQLRPGRRRDRADRPAEACRPRAARVARSSAAVAAARPVRPRRDDRPPVRGDRHLRAAQRAADQPGRAVFTATPADSHAPGPTCSSSAARGHDDYDGWEAALCGLAGKARDLRNGRNRASGHYQQGRAPGTRSSRRAISSSTPWPPSARCADADLAAQVHEALPAPPPTTRRASSAPAPSTSSTC